MPLAFIYFEFELAATPGIFVDAHVLCFTAAGGGDDLLGIALLV